ncbi:MAG: hypothetical protein KJ065_09125 [Anaerolineae bacterium]|nr:hypothetical protein [Anaerolineae bacterium]
MPLYTYRREDGTTFDLRQSFSDDPLTKDPETGQAVVRVVQAAPVIFKGSGFYVNDHQGKSKSSLTSAPKAESSDKGAADVSSSSKEATKPAATTTAAAAD